MDLTWNANVRNAVILCVGAARLCERGIGNPADSVAVQLAPGKAFTVAVVDRDALAFQCLRQQHGIHRRRPAQRRDRLRHAKFLASNEARSLHLTLEIFGGDL
jgi:hypothetical protein